MKKLPALHLIAPFHTIPNAATSHCAFTAKALRFSKMMQGFFGGRGIVEYANAGSESCADEHVRILTAREWQKYYAPKGKEDFWGNKAIHGTSEWRIFHDRLCHELRKRVLPGDFIAHPFGHAHINNHGNLVKDFPDQCHVETGIGYPDAPTGAWRIFESEAWKHWHWGRHGEEHGFSTNKSFTYVIPNYFDLRDWPVVAAAPKTQPYVLFMGRITGQKGLGILVDIIRHWKAVHPKSPLRFKVAGQGDWGPIAADLQRTTDVSIGVPALDIVDYLGPVSGTKRAPLIGNAVASIMPTEFIEPFGGSGVEGLLCGTPLLASDWGAFTETVVQGVTGYRCQIMTDWLAAIALVLDGALSRRAIAAHARERYSLEACRVKYERAFTLLHSVKSGAGWYHADDVLLRG